MHTLSDLFKKHQKGYEDFKTKLESLITELLVHSNINYHKLECRVKEVDKLDEKIIRKNEKYRSLADITDLIGIRIITYFEDEVDKVADLINAEFIIDKENSVDRRRSESDRFGYKSLHYVVTLSNQRKNLTEYKRFEAIKIEIQIRSILQHAWAEIEHDIGYKGELAIPDILKRNFYRVAALLETADVEFVNIKEKLKLYEKSVSESIKKTPEEVELNSASLDSFITAEGIANELDKKIAANSNYKLAESSNDHLALLEKLYFLNIKTIKDLAEALEENSNIILLFAKEWLGDGKGESMHKGISIFYLCYVLVGKKNNLDFANEYYFNIVMKGFKREDIISSGQNIVDTFKKVNSG